MSRIGGSKSNAFAIVDRTNRFALSALSRIVHCGPEGAECYEKTYCACGTATSFRGCTGHARFFAGREGARASALGSCSRLGGARRSSLVYGPGGTPCRFGHRAKHGFTSRRAEARDARIIARGNGLLAEHRSPPRQGLASLARARAGSLSIDARCARLPVKRARQCETGAVP
jgi:hypothetical protein